MELPPEPEPEYYPSRDEKVAFLAAFYTMEGLGGVPGPQDHDGIISLLEVVQANMPDEGVTIEEVTGALDELRRQKDSEPPSGTLDL